MPVVEVIDEGGETLLVVEADKAATPPQSVASSPKAASKPQSVASSPKAASKPQSVASSPKAASPPQSVHSSVHAAVSIRSSLQAAPMHVHGGSVHSSGSASATTKLRLLEARAKAAASAALADKAQLELQEALAAAETPGGSPRGSLGGLSPPTLGMEAEDWFSDQAPAAPLLTDNLNKLQQQLGPAQNLVPGFVTSQTHVPAPPGLGTQLDSGEWVQPIGRNVFLDDVDSSMWHAATGFGTLLTGQVVQTASAALRRFTRPLRPPLHGTFSEQAEELREADEKEQLTQRRSTVTQWRSDWP